MKIFFLSFILIFACVSCDLSSPEEVDNAEIEEILRDIENAFIYYDLSAIMQHYHPGFLHGTNSYNFEQVIWEIRMNEFDLISIENIEIDLNDSFAVVAFTLIFDDLTTQEPSAEHGDLSYFYREYDDWKICGNNFTEP